VPLARRVTATPGEVPARPARGASSGRRRRRPEASHEDASGPGEARKGPSLRPRPTGRYAPRPAACGGPEIALVAAKTRAARGGEFSSRRREAFHRGSRRWRLWTGRRRKFCLNFFATAANASRRRRRADRSAPTAPCAAAPRQETARLPRRLWDPAAGPLRGPARCTGTARRAGTASPAVFAGPK